MLKDGEVSTSRASDVEVWKSPDDPYIHNKNITFPNHIHKFYQPIKNSIISPILYIKLWNVSQSSFPRRRLLITHAGDLR